MALTPQVLTDVRLYYAAADLTGYSNKIAVQASAADLKTTNFGSNGWTERVGGQFSGTLAAEGFFQAGDASLPDDSLFANLGVSTVPVTAVPTSGTVGSTAYLTRVLETSYKPGAPVGQVLAWTADALTNWPYARGVILHPQGTARTATGNGTGVQIGAVSAAQRMYACLHVFSISGTATPTITVKIQSSVDNTFASPTDRITFTAATAIGGQTGSVLGAVTDQWWRAVWTISGTSPSFLFAVSAGVAAK